ncbi:MAG: hypothetical protein A2Y25_08490 [Candidatus Melainabacteria bacterium GWF2_37_15]|nr:MAG: hypothetical protein A2Y25_08490 [Candidatus Melainabacteria bacterium GWF2_37_15]
MPNPDNDKQEYLKNIIIHTLTSYDLEEAIRNITMELGKLFNADRVHFRLYDEGMGVFSEVIEEYRKNESIPSAKGKMIYPQEFDICLKNRLLEEKHIYIIDDVNKSEYPESFKQLFKNLDINNEIVFPIFYMDNLESAFFITNTASEELLSKKNLEYLMPVAKELSIGTHLFKIQNSLVKKAEYEKILREIIMEVRLYERPQQIFEYLVKRLANLYAVNRAAHLQVDSEGNFVVIFEAISDNQPELKCQTIFTSESFKELTAHMEHKIVVINDVEQIKNEKLRKYLYDNNIRAFMLYPLEETIHIAGGKKITDRIMLCSPVPRKWTGVEIENLELIAGTIDVVYSDILRKKEVNEIQETFLASLIHDLRSPILGEQKALEFLMSRKPDTTIQDIAEYHLNMYTTNEDLLNIINNLLGVYSLELGQHEVAKEPSDINKIINDGIKSIKRLADENEDTISVNTQEKLSEIKMDPDEIKRVIINLASNAIKHNPKGINIKISAEQRDNEILLSVADNGVGIPESDKVNIFQKYPKAKRQIGTGLGLYLSKQIVGLHGGKIWFESEEGKGTIFYFTLPI